jgi:hypothetical protein
MVAEPLQIHQGDPGLHLAEERGTPPPWRTTASSLAPHTPYHHTLTFPHYQSLTPQQAHVVYVAERVFDHCKHATLYKFGFKKKAIVKWQGRSGLHHTACDEPRDTASRVLLIFPIYHSLLSS